LEYDINRPWLTLDDWQKDYIKAEGNCFVCCGRQCGKTAAVSIKFAERAVNVPNSVILMVALTEKQAYNLFFKTFMYLSTRYRSEVKSGKDKPTKHQISLKNGSKIMCLAAGEQGLGLKGFTCTSVVIDEAASMNREIFTALSPMLSVTNGSMDIISTPLGKEGYFYECSKREDFKKFYISAEDCPRHKKEFLEAEKASMSKLQYAQEYLAVFLDELKRVFSEQWIKDVCVLKRPERINPQGTYFLGVDIARMGDDLSSFEVIQKVNKKDYQQVESITTSKTLTTETEKKILELEATYHFKQIYLDAGAGTLGVSIFDHLLNEDSTKRKIVAINNRDRPLDRDEKSKSKLLKEDLYNNLLALGEQGYLKLLDDDEIILSLRSMQYEYVIKKSTESKLRIFTHFHSDIVEGLVRAAWCSKDKSLNIWVGY